MRGLVRAHLHTPVHTYTHPCIYQITGRPASLMTLIFHAHDPHLPHTHHPCTSPSHHISHTHHPHIFHTHHPYIFHAYPTSSRLLALILNLKTYHPHFEVEDVLPSFCRSPPHSFCTGTHRPHCAASSQTYDSHLAGSFPQMRPEKPGSFEKHLQYTFQPWNS